MSYPRTADGRIAVYLTERQRDLLESWLRIIRADAMDAGELGESKDLDAILKELSEAGT